MVDHERRILRDLYQVSFCCLAAETLTLLTQRNRAWIHSVTNKLRNKPLLDMAGGIIEDYEFLWDQYYFPTATL
jgi:hypothetical protein